MAGNRRAGDPLRVSEAYVRALPRRDDRVPLAVGLVTSPQTSVDWQRAVVELAGRYALRIVGREVQPEEQAPRVPLLLRAILRADGWRPAAPGGELRGGAPAAGEPPLLLLHLGALPPVEALGTRSRYGVVHATANGRPLGGDADFVAELARGVATASVEVWWTRAGRAPVRVLRSISMMRSGVARVNDAHYAVRVAELLLEGARSVLDDVDGSRDEVTAAGASRPVAEREDTDLLARRAREAAARAAAPLRARDAAGLVVRRLRTALGQQRLPREWTIGYRRTTGEGALESFGRIAESELLVPPAGVTWADPFPVRVEGVDLLFFEEQASLESAGRLVVAELYADGRLSPPRPILDAVAHHSYPHVFPWQGEWFLVPESAALGVVSLYRATDFPHRWHHECDLLTGVSLVDPTLLQRDGRWYLVATRVTADDEAIEELCCFSAPTLTGPWREHANSPVLRDAYRGRGGGRFLEDGGRLLRPAQDSSILYGHGLSLQHVSALSPDAWREETVVHASTTWAPNLDGVHTFNRSDTLTCIDVARRIRRGSSQGDHRLVAIRARMG